MLAPLLQTASASQLSPHSGVCRKRLRLAAALDSINRPFGHQESTLHDRDMARGTQKVQSKETSETPEGQESRITGTQTLAKAESSVGGGGPRQGETRLRDCVRKSFSFLMPQDSAGANGTRPS